MLSLLAQAADAPVNPVMAFLTGPTGMIALLVGIFWFMILRPQQKQQAQHKAFLDGLKKGDEVITTGGIIGKISAVAEHFYTIDIANNVKVRVLKGQVSGPFVPGAPVDGAKASTAAAAPAEEAKK